MYKNPKTTDDYLLLYINSKLPHYALYMPFLNLRIIKNNPLTIVVKGFYNLYILFPLYSAWWLRSDVIDYAVNVIYFIYDTA